MIQTDLSSKLQALFILLALLALGFAEPGHAESRKIIIRFTAASYFYQQDFQPNRPLDVLKSSAGFDVLFRTNYFDDTLYMSPGASAQLLTAAGTTTLRESPDAFGRPGATCDGTLRHDPKFPPVLNGQDVTQNGAIKTIKIQIPGINNNTHSGVGLLSDPSQVYFACMTPQIGTGVYGGGVTQTFAWVPVGNFVPEDANPDSAGAIRGTYAIFQFDIRNLPVTIPLSFKRESKVVADGKTIDEQKHVWFGQVTVSHDKGEQYAPIDPLTYGGYTPPVGTTDIPPDPPVIGPPPSTGGWNTWLKDVTEGITNHLNNVSKRWQQILGGSPARLRALAASTSVETFNLSTSTASITGLSTAPGNGNLEVHIVFRDPKKLKGFKPKLPSSAVDNPVSTGQSANVSVLFDAKAKKALSSKKAFTAFVIVRVTPSDGSKPIQKVKRFKKAKVKK